MRKVNGVVRRKAIPEGTRPTRGKQILPVKLEALPAVTDTRLYLEWRDGANVLGTARRAAARTLRVVRVAVRWDVLEDKKRIMDSSLMAYALITSINHVGRSALPHAPVVAERLVGGSRMRLSYLRGRLASILHQAAWAIEPAPAGCAVTRRETAAGSGCGMPILMDIAKERS